MISSLCFVLRNCLRLPAFLVFGLLLSSCVLTDKGADSISGDFRSQSASNYNFKIEKSPGRLVVLPFTVSLQRHFLVKDPVYQRAEYGDLNQSIASVVKSWSEYHGLDLQILDAAKSSNLFASQRLTSTTIRLLNKKKSVDGIPALSDLMENLELAEAIRPADERNGSVADSTDLTDLILAGTYTGNLKSGGQLIKEKVSSSMRYLGGFGRRQVRRPASGFGKLFAVLLDANSGQLLWFGDADAAPGAVSHAMAALLTGIEKSATRGEPVNSAAVNVEQIHQR